MTRQEKIVEAAQQYGGSNEEMRCHFIDGCHWADEHPINYDGKAMLHVLNKGVAIGRREMLGKACEWLYNRQQVDLVVPNIEKFINDFKKDMEEQQ